MRWDLKYSCFSLLIPSMYSCDEGWTLKENYRRLTLHIPGLRNMVLKLYGVDNATCGKRVGIILHEKRVSFELVPIDATVGEHKSPQYLEKQPFGQVPYIDDDGFILYESRAISRYLEEKYPSQGTKLIPTELKARALFEQAASNECFNFDPFASGAARELVFPAAMGKEPNKAAGDELLAKLDAKLEAYDCILEKQKYLAGDEITMADLFHIPYGTLLAVAGSELMTSRPNVKRWWTDISSRPSWQAVSGGVKSTTF
ncbi:glutathione S-transferase [Flagelloscypha sp. PMI_526]|nr:glutathione S-transferase [Flagelloscypha sp. PMI_526]